MYIPLNNVQLEKIRDLIYTTEDTVSVIFGFGDDDHFTAKVVERGLCEDEYGVELGKMTPCLEDCFDWHATNAATEVDEILGNGKFWEFECLQEFASKIQEIAQKEKYDIDGYVNNENAEKILVESGAAEAILEEEKEILQNNWITSGDCDTICEKVAQAYQDEIRRYENDHENETED